MPLVGPKQLMPPERNHWNWQLSTGGTLTVPGTRVVTVELVALPLAVAERTWQPMPLARGQRNATVSGWRRFWTGQFPPGWSRVMSVADASGPEKADHHFKVEVRSAWSRIVR